MLKPELKKRPVIRWLMITILVLAGIVAALFFNQKPDAQKTEPTKTVEVSEVSRKAAQPTLSTLKPLPSEDEITQPPLETDAIEFEEEAVDYAQIEKEQTAIAIELINSNKDEERIEGVEQLGAYPSAEMELILGQLLATDTNPDVRNAAILSLGSIETFSNITINNLMNALEDESADVRFNALSTLQNSLLAMEKGSVSYKLTIDELIAKTSEQTLSIEIRDAINELLNNQKVE